MPDELLEEVIANLMELVGGALQMERTLRKLLGAGVPRLLNPEVETVLEHLLALREATVEQALARLDFRDNVYRFIRAIDGDTVVVEPPRQLRNMMKDVHLRLYGLETPELWMENGELYRRHLEDLCAQDASGALKIVWERERLGTRYQGYPLSSFERGIGHVFFADGKDSYYHVNALMHVLKHSSVTRGDRVLLRGASHLSDVSLLWSGRCPIAMDKDGECSETFRKMRTMAPPICLIRYSRLPSLDPRKSSYIASIGEMFKQIANMECPFSEMFGKEALRFEKLICEQRMSLFDLPLIHLSKWAEQLPSSES